MVGCCFSLVSWELKALFAGLGPGTLVGSAAFNLYPILAVCVLVPKAGSVKRIQNVGVWIVELFWSIWAYIWLAIILQVSSPNVVEPWEAICTVLQFPILMIHAYAQDIGWRPLWPSMNGSWKRLSDSSLPVYNADLHDQSSTYSNPGYVWSIFYSLFVIENWRDDYRVDSCF